MKKFILTKFVIIMSALGLYGQTQISTVTELKAINRDVASLEGNYILMNDLTIEQWTPIGTVKNPFNGVFNGNGFTITIMGFNTNGVDVSSDGNVAFSAISIGLFGATGIKSVIKNLKVAGDLTYDSGEITLYMGAIVGNNRGIIVNCVSTANINAMGGLYSAKRGWGQYGLTLLANTGNTKTTAFITYQNESCGGGIAGLNRRLIKNCYTTGNVTVSGKGHKTAGGIAGRNGFGNGNKGSIIHCYAMGDIVSKEDGASRLAGGITSMCTPGDILHSVALNTRLETVGNRKGMTVGGLGAGYPANISFGVVASVIEPTNTDTKYDPEAIRNSGFLAVEARKKFDSEANKDYEVFTGYTNDYKSRVKNAFYRIDMSVYEAKDEVDEKTNKKVKKNILQGNRGKAIEYALTQEQNWWMNSKTGVFFPFGDDEFSPWVWREDLKRPVLYWESF
jgi:hypothetical protein